MKNLLFSTVLLIALYSCSHTETKHHEVHHLQFSTPLVTDTFVVQDYVCQIHSYQHIEIRALERGYLEEIFVDEGQFVKKGQLLFQIMPNLYKAELEKAKAEARFAEIEYNNTKKLADNNIVAPNELALAKAKLDQAKAELSLAQVHLDFTQIRAPFDGIIDHLHMRLGSLVEEGELLTTLSDNHEMWVYFNVPEAEYLNYKLKFREDSSLKVKLRLANQQIFEQIGEVTTIEADFDQSTGNIEMRATFPNPTGLLRHGETGNVLVHSVLDHALLIPQKSTYEILDKKYVFVLDENNEVHSRLVKVEAELPHVYSISKGLKENDKILIEGLRKVKDGDKVDPFYTPANEVFSELQISAE